MVNYLGTKHIKKPKIADILHVACKRCNFELRIGKSRVNIQESTKYFDLFSFFKFSTYPYYNHLIFITFA